MLRKLFARSAVALVALWVFGAVPVRTQSQSPMSTKVVSPEQRVELLSRATVWQPPRVPISEAHLGSDRDAKSLSCQFEVTELGGTARKFDCRDESGMRLRVKYGGSPEIPSEVAAARLLATLGFGADGMALAEKLRCFGCPKDPFVVMKAVDLTQTDGIYKKFVDYDKFVDFEWVAVERRHSGRAIASKDLSGWSFFELEKIEPAKGGAPRAHVDALRLLAVFLAHWDNKAENQRLVCLSEQDWAEDQSCRKPFAMLQDLGAAFGPRKVDFDGWQQTPVWKDRGRCIVTMESLPYSGSTFQDVQISEAGRRHLATLMTQLTDRQLTDLFSGARFDQRAESLFMPPIKPAADWARVFQDKVRQISEGPRCPR